MSERSKKPHLINARTSQNAHDPAASHPNFRPVFSAPTPLCPSRARPFVLPPRSPSHSCWKHCAHVFQECQSGEPRYFLKHSSDKYCDMPAALESQGMGRRGLVPRRMLRDVRWSLSGCVRVEMSGQYLLASGAGDELGLRRCRRAFLALPILRLAEREAMCCRRHSQFLWWSDKVEILPLLETQLDVVWVCLAALAG